jgi:CubicO group peptidase (beta-lactamase class C family)
MLYTPAVFSQEQPSIQVSLQQLTSGLYAQGKLHGGILIAEGEQIILSEAWGIADHDKKKILTPDDPFYLNSLGKMFTSIVIMQMVEEGTLTLDNSLSEIYPDFKQSRSSEITLHHLLSHRSGIPDYVMAQMRGMISPDVDGLERLSAMAHMELEFDPGTMFHYSNTGYYLLGLIIEKYHGKSYGAVIHEDIFEPLGMQNTAHNPTNFYKDVPVYYMQDGTTVSGITGDPESGDNGVSTMKDLYIFMASLGSEKLLKKASWELMFTPHSLPSEVPEGAWPPPHQDPYGYGFSLLELPYEGNRTAKAVGHGGAGLGSNYVVRYLENPRIVIVWNNIFKNPVLPEVFEYLANKDID